MASCWFSQHLAQRLAYGGSSGKVCQMNKRCSTVCGCCLLQYKNKTESKTVIKYLTSFHPRQVKLQMFVCVGEAEHENISEHAGNRGSGLFRTATFLAGETESTVDGEELAAASGDGRQEGEDGGWV